MTNDPAIPPGSREREIFLAAREQTDPAARAAFLDTACGSDVALRRRVEDLLRAQAGLGGFLEKPALSGETEVMTAGTERAGDRIGRYKLLQQIGEGGTGVVYMAEQEQPVRRRVALKVIKLGMDTRSIIARFEVERQALAMMDHPNIAKVFDAGATEAGRPFFVMELVRGVRITDYCDQHNLPTAERLSLFIQVCQAIQHAHQKGIIHRDIKPSNILVTLHDGTPVPKVIDFGIAKATEQRLTDKTLFTQFTSFIGTPAYMSPEQAEMSGLDIDTRSDIYALGVLLYELLTGKTPFDAEALHAAGLDECRRTIREKEPARPSTRLATLVEADLTTTARQRRTESAQLIHSLRGDLDWIAMKCLEKDRTRRYDAANTLAADVQRYLDNEPVLARPPSTVYRCGKFVRRHRGVIAAATAIVVTLVTGAGLSTWQAIRATRAERDAHAMQLKETDLRRQAETEKKLARLNEYVADINLAQQSLAAGNLGRALQLLDKHRPAPGEPDLRGFEWRFLWHRCQGDEHAPLPAQEGPVQSLALSPSGEVLAVGLRDKLNVYNLRTRALLASLPKGVASMAFLPDGQTLVTAALMSMRAWNTTDWTERKHFSETGGPLALSRDGARLATTAGREGVRLWDTSNWREERTLPGATGPLAFSPDGRAILTDTRAGLTLWPLDGSSTNRVLPESTNLFARGGPWFRSDRVVTFSPDGRWVVAARNTLSERGVFVIGLWDTQSGLAASTLPGDPEHVEHTGAISSLAFSPDGRTLATASVDHSIRLWDFAARQRVATFQGHLSEILALAFTPDGQMLVSGAKDGTVKLWPLHRQQKDDALAGPWHPLGFSKDGRTLAALDRQGTVSFINVATREPEQQFQLEITGGRPHFGPPPGGLPGGGPLPSGPPPGEPRGSGPPREMDRPMMRPGTRVGVSADLSLLAHALDDGRVQLWNTRTRESSFLKAADTCVDLLALSPDGRLLITGGWGQPLRWWDLRTGTNAVVESDAFQVFFSPDGRTLAALGRSGAVEIWDTVTRSPRTNLVSEAQPGFAAAFSPDGRTLGIACFDDVVRLWDTATGRLLGACAGHKQTVFAVAFSPDGRTLATASDDSTLKLWNAATQQELLTIRRLGGALRELVFAPDGQLLVGAGGGTPSASGLRFYRAPDAAPEVRR